MPAVPMLAQYDIRHPGDLPRQCPDIGSVEHIAELLGRDPEGWDIVARSGLLHGDEGLRGTDQCPPEGR